MISEAQLDSYTEISIDIMYSSDTMSKELQQFYNELWAWINSGFYEDAVFVETASIDENLFNWAEDFSTYHRLTLENMFQFKRSGYEVDCGYTSFDKTIKLHYKCPVRLAFIERQAKKSVV